MTQTRMARTTNAPPLISSTTDELARQRIIAEDDEKEDEAPRGGGLGIGLEFRAQRRQRQALEWHTFSLPLTTRCSRLRRAPRRLTLARMIVVLTSYRRGLHLWLALGNVLLAASELHHSSCRSVGHPDDSDGAACFGWCSPAFGGEHCSWCRCRGCVFCDAIALANPAAAASFATVISGSAGPVSGRNPTPAGGGGIISGSTPSVSSGVTTVAATALGSGDGTGADESSVCQSSIADDVSYKDCQPFCSPAFRDDHCAACKCRACHFCGCSSELADDSPDERCESWCSADFEDAHCAACKCKGCQFCRMGKACTPADESDSNTESCDAFCDAKFASSHCNQCKCKRCGFCKPGGAHGGVLGHDGGGGGGAGARGGNGGGGGAGGKTGGKEKDGGGNPGHASAHAASHDTGFLPLGAACSSDAPIGVWDSEESACESFCSSEHRSAHCALCKCRACDLCKCQSAVANDSEEERCEPWCSRSFHAVHCGMCKCKACGFCVHGVACAPFEQGDSEVERCEAFCKPSFADAHCQMCKCRGCSFCSTVYPPEPPKPPRPPLPPLAAPAPPPIPGATAQGAAEALAGLMASHSRLLWGHSVSEWIVPSAGLIQVYTDGRQRHLWSTADANAAAEQSLLSTARLITTGLVVTAVVIGCLMTCSAQLGGREYGSVITAEE